MQLASLYIKGRVKGNDSNFHFLEDSPYKTLKNVSLNFSNRIIVKYELGDEIISIQNNPNYIEGFFDSTNKVKNVTAIIGENGTGKSSILDFIKGMRFDKPENNLYKFISIYEREDTLRKKIEIYIFHHQSIKIDLKKSKLNLPDNITIEKLLPIGSVQDSELTYPFFKIIYFSNILEITQTRLIGGDDNDVTPIDDISTTTLLNEDVGVKKNKIGSFSFDECYHSHSLMECKRQLAFILDETVEKLPFPIPNFITIEPDLFYEKEIENQFKDNNLSPLFKSISNAQILVNPKDLKESFIFHLHKSILFYLIRYFTLEDTSNRIPIFNIIERNKMPNYISINEMERCIVEIENEMDKQNYAFDSKNKIKALLNVIKGVKELDISNFMHGLNTSPIAVLKIKDNLDLLNSYQKSLFITSYANLTWRYSNYSIGEMSSGEKALFSFYSRFHDLNSNYTFTANSNKNIMILIDEGDQLLHPEWQRHFFSRIVKFFPIIFNESESIQIIMTSHSPFIVSDLPNYCIQYLKKLGDKTYIENGFDSFSTLGANIHQLYTDSFFLPNGLIGEFARSKINDLIIEIKNKESLTNEESKKLLIRAEMIGEEFISQKIIELIQSKVQL